MMQVQIQVKGSEVKTEMIGAGNQTEVELVISQMERLKFKLLKTLDSDENCTIIKDSDEGSDEED